LLSDFAKAGPTPDELLACAHRIIKIYASPEPVLGNMNLKAPVKDPISGTESTMTEDIMHRNIKLLTYDILYDLELVNAISTGNFGHV
jgi:hypothetical protein